MCGAILETNVRQPKKQRPYSNTMCRTKKQRRLLLTTVEGDNNVIPWYVVFTDDVVVATISQCD